MYTLFQSGNNLIKIPYAGGIYMSDKNEVSTTWLIAKSIRDIRSFKLAKKEKNNEFKDEIKEAVDALESARRYFDYVNDPQLIDYAIYSEKAAISRLSYLLRKAKESCPKLQKNLNL